MTGSHNLWLDLTWLISWSANWTFPAVPLLPHAAFSPASTANSISQLWQLQNCYKFHTFPHASQRCVPASLVERHYSRPATYSPLSFFLFLLPFPVYLYGFFCFWFAGNYINCNSLFSGFCFLLSSPSLFAMLLLSALCLVKLLVSLLWEARGKSRVGGGSVAVKLLLVLQSGRVMQMQESCN